MKTLFTSLFFVLILLAACAQAPAYQAGATYGETVAADKAISMTELEQQMRGKTEMPTVVEGPVEAVCQVKGCWMTLPRPNGDLMRVSFTDYGFFVPKDIAGKTVVVDGTAKFETTSVDELRHYAEDEGLPQEEIDKITEPEVELVFVADGVIVR